MVKALRDKGAKAKDAEAAFVAAVKALDEKKVELEAAAKLAAEEAAAKLAAEEAAAKLAAEEAAAKLAAENNEL